MTAALAAGLRASAGRILPLAWPVVVGQLAVLSYSTIDTLLLARHDALDLAALALGASAYVTVFVGLMGVLLGVSPIVGRLYGAGRHAEAGAQWQQAVWLALMLALLGSSLLAWPEPFLAIAQASPEVEAKARSYLSALALSLPASLLFTTYRGFNTAVSRPKAVMAMQLSGLCLKLPLTWLLVGGASFGPLQIPALGLTGCGIATACVMWTQALGAMLVLRHDRFYAPFALWGQRWPGPRWSALKPLLRLGVPNGLATLIEVSGFTFMAFFIARLGATPLAGHQIAANLVAMLFMLPLGLANATATLVAQRIGAGDLQDAQRIGWHGIQLAALIASALGITVFVLRPWVLRLYSPDPVIVAAALPLLAWVVLFHIGDAVQCVAGFVLRAWHVATVPVLIYALSLWGLGLGGGYALVHGELAPPGLQGAAGFWAASTASLVVAALALCALLRWVLKQKLRP